jgi:hypothetical protein
MSTQKRPQSQIMKKALKVSKPKNLNRIVKINESCQCHRDIDPGFNITK